MATNIAESSITVPDVKYVIDFCLSKQIKFDTHFKMERLEKTWASRASLKQRAGRTGRVAAGVCIRLIFKQFYEKKLDEYTEPEMRRVSLDRIILKIKQLNEDENCGYIFENPFDVLGRAIQPPKIESIKYSVKSLMEIGALQ